jgi:hypothetical protein
MAVLFSIADGNINATASWGVVEPTSFQGTPNATVVSGVAVTTLITGTSFILASSVTVSGIVLQLSGRATSVAGTLNIQLYDVTGATIVGQATVNITDLPNSNTITTSHIDWTYFKFSSSVTTVAGRTYAIRAQASVINQVSWYYTTTTTNPNRALVTTTNQAPVASDQLIIAGSYTSAGVNSITTITMNYTSSIYAILGNIWISSKGILTFATNILAYLPISGYLVVGVGGTLNIGTSLNPITNSVDIQMNCTTALQYPIWVYGVMNTYGQSKVIAAKLVGDVIAGATSSTTSTVTGWKIFDSIIVTSTTRTYTQFEAISLNANAAGTSLSSHSNYGFAHGGDPTTKVQADMINATRNITIRGNGAPLANKTNIQMFSTSITSFYYTSFIGLGTGITVANSGICVNILNSGYTFEMQYCFIGDNGQAATNTINTALFNQNTINTTISNNLFYGLGWTTTVVSTINVYDFDDSNYVIGCLATTQVLLTTNIGSNNTFSSNNTPVTISNLSNSSNNSFYSNNTIGLNISNPTITTATLTNYKIWRNNTYGISFTFTSSYNKNTILTFDGLYCFGNTSGSLATNRHHIKVYFTNSFFYGGSTLVQPNHFIGTGNIVDSFYYNNCYFGYSDTSLTSSPFSGAILQVPVPNITKIFNNCYFNGTEISVTTGYPTVNITGSYLSLNHNGLINSNRQWFSNGTIYSDGLYVGSTSSQVYSPNLVKWTDNMKKTNWTKSTLDTITLFQLAPDGSYTAMLIDETGASGDPNTVSQSNIVATDTTITFSIYTKTGTATTRRFLLRNTTTSTNFDSIPFDYIGTGNFGNGWTSTDVGSGWFRLSYTRTTGISIGDLLVIYCGRTGAASVGSTDTWYIWGPQVNAGSTTLPYQKVNDVNFDTFTSLGKSLRLTPSSPVYKLNTPLVKVPVKIGTTCTITVKIRRSILGDGATYNGATPRLMYAFNPVLGNTTETVGQAPAGFTNSQWEQLTYTTGTFSNDGVAEFYVDCDGTVGWINVDDWDVTTSVDTRANDYWGVNATYVEPDFKRGTRSYTFVK